MSNYLLGISAGFHDSSACLVDTSGIVHYASSEERFTRNKGDKSFPDKAIEECINYCNTNNGKIFKICLHENPSFGFPKPYRSPLRKYINANIQYLSSVRDFFEHLRKIAKKLNLRNSDIFFSRHHLSHAYSAISTSSEDAGIICVMDAIGENHSGLIGSFKDGKITNSILIPIQESLGLIYSLVTVYCGFKVLTGEYKLMGLAPYGKPKYFETLNRIFWDPKYNKPTIADINIYSSTLYSDLLSKHLGFPARNQNSQTITQQYADLAASIQLFLELKVNYLIQNYIEASNQKKYGSLVLSGGVALNCKLNYTLSENFASNFNEIWAYPASGDAGSSIGACINYLRSFRFKNKNEDRSSGMFLGSQYSNQEVICDNYSIIYHKSSNNLEREQLLTKVCSLMNAGKIGAIYEHRSEFGPRALGNRSIIADATNPDSLKLINRNVKNREDFRPLAPIVLETEASKYFSLNEKCSNMYKYMLCLAKSKNIDCDQNIFDVAGSTREIKPKSSLDRLIPAVVHHDGTARIQIVSNKEKSTIVNLLKSYLNQYKIGLLINTSFNVRGEPIVNTPADALDCFLEAKLDFLILQDLFIFRDDQNSFILDVQKKSYELD